MFVLNFEFLLSILWILLSIATYTLGYLTIFIKSSYVPQFIKSLLFFGKFGKEPHLVDARQKPEYERRFSIFELFNSLVKSLEVPKRWFLHFYIWLFVVWCVVLGDLLFARGQRDFNVASGSLLLFIVVQSVRRTFECLYVSVYSDNTINFVHYATGIVFYASLGYACHSSILLTEPSSIPSLPATTLSWGIFITASYFQYKSHRILADLRHDKKQAKSYHLPTKSLFKYVACPHYLCEILIYVSILLLVKITFLWSSLFLFVVVNQTIASLLAHRWYRIKFGDKFSSNTKAIIPFLL